MKPISFRISKESSTDFEKIHGGLTASIKLKKSDVARIIFERGIKDIQINGLPFFKTNIKTGK